MPRLSLTPTPKLEHLQSSISTRWVIAEWSRFYPWRRLPAKGRILMYAGRSVQFFFGLQYLKSLLESNACFHTMIQCHRSHWAGRCADH